MSVKILIVFVCLQICCSAMTMKQIRNTGKTLRKTCLPKSGADEANVNEIGAGNFAVDDKETMCYVACIMKMVNTIKNGKINYEAAMKQADAMLPDEIREPAKVALTKCRKVAETYKDLCEAAFYTAKCIYEADPDIFYFP